LIMRITILLSICSTLIHLGLGSSDGSKCPGVSCSPPMPGADCRAQYGRDDGCCPEWSCTMNGYTSTIYGKMSSGSSGSSSHYSSSSSSGGGGQSSSSFSSSSSSGFGNLPGFQFQLPNFGNLFG